MIDFIQHTPVTFSLIILNVYATWIYFRLREDRQVELLFFPYEVFRGRKLHGSITSMFVHSSWEHLMFNMLSLYFLAPWVEQAIGGVLFFLLYFLSGFSADIAQLLKFKNVRNYCSLGSSGATSGVVFSFIVENPMAYLQMPFVPIGFPAFFFGILYLVASFYQSKRGQGFIAHEAHIGGALGGSLFMYLILSF